MKYRRRESNVEAIQYMIDNGKEIVDWAGSESVYLDDDGMLSVSIEQGEFVAEKDTWLVKDSVIGIEVYHDDQFHKTFEVIE